MRTRVELWNESDESAIAATRATVRMLGGDIERDPAGRFWLIGPAFVSFACERQGYVKRVLPEVTS